MEEILKEIIQLENENKEKENIAHIEQYTDWKLEKIFSDLKEYKQNKISTLRIGAF